MIAGDQQRSSAIIWKLALTEFSLRQSTHNRSSSLFFLTKITGLDQALVLQRIKPSSYISTIWRLDSSLCTYGKRCVCCFIGGLLPASILCVSNVVWPKPSSKTSENLCSRHCTRSLSPSAKKLSSTEWTLSVNDFNFRIKMIAQHKSGIKR